MLKVLRWFKIGLLLTIVACLLFLIVLAWMEALIIGVMCTLIIVVITLAAIIVNERTIRNAFKDEDQASRSAW
jgi:FtsH-binding integral membrane protein